MDLINKKAAMLHVFISYKEQKADTANRSLTLP